MTRPDNLKHPGPGAQRSLNSYLSRLSYRKLALPCLALLAYSFVKLVLFDATVANPHYDTISIETWNKTRAPRHSPRSALESWEPMSAVNGPPTRKFRDNLKTDLKYITAWPSAGWTNDVISTGNLIYLALLTERIPIIPAFTPSHVTLGAKNPVPPLPFGDVFDIPRLSKAIGTPVLQWEDVKNVTNQASSDLETIGCWDIWQATQYDDKHPRSAPVTLAQLNLDVSYTTAPGDVKLIPNFYEDKHALFPALAALTYPDYRKSSLGVPAKSPIMSETLHPDEHLACFDYMYYMCSLTFFEISRDYGAVWRQVGRHMHWTPRLLEIGKQYVRKATNTRDGEPTPDWIAVHVRHQDFGTWCGDVPIYDCFAPISAIKRRIDEVKEELATRLNITNVEVLVTSDEQDVDWWQEINALGYKTIDHSGTVAEYGRWYPVLIDAVIQSTGVGFVGTHKSTMSAMAHLRVRSWKDGAARSVRWGKIGADDHAPDDMLVDLF